MRQIMKKNIIIIGNSVVGKSALINIYIHVFQGCILIDGKIVFTSSILTPTQIAEYKECSRLIIDDLFLLTLNSSMWESILEIIEYRCNYSKFMLITGYFAEFSKYRTETIKKLLTTSQPYDMNVETDVFNLMTHIYLAERHIDKSRPMKIYLMKKEGACLHCTDTELDFQPNEWVQLLQETSFLKFLEIGELQCLSCDKEGNEFLSGDILFTQAKEYFLRFTQLNNLPIITKEKFEIALKSWDSLDNSKLYLGIDFYKRKV